MQWILQNAGANSNPSLRTLNILKHHAFPCKPGTSPLRLFQPPQHVLPLQIGPCPLGEYWPPFVNLCRQGGNMCFSRLSWCGKMFFEVSAGVSPYCKGTRPSVDWVILSLRRGSYELQKFLSFTVLLGWLSPFFLQGVGWTIIDLP